jgi:hypothetical protein
MNKKKHLTLLPLLEKLGIRLFPVNLKEQCHEILCTFMNPLSSRVKSLANYKIFLESVHR